MKNGLRWESFLKRDKLNLDIFWLKDESPEDSANGIRGQTSEIVGKKDLEAALQQFAAMANDLKR